MVRKGLRRNTKKKDKKKSQILAIEIIIQDTFFLIII